MSVTVAQDGLGVRFDGAFAWANSAPVNTVQSLTVPISGAARQAKKYHLVIHNPSTVTALAVNVQVGENLAGADRWVNSLAEITVPVNSVYADVVEDLFVGALARIRASNATVLGVADAFTATIRIRELED